MRTSIAARAPLIDLCKVVAIQLIVWHHLAFYGPMSDVVYPLAPGLFDWLYDRGRLAVQVFLVIGGYLAAQSLARRLGNSRWQAPTLQPMRLVWQRFLRLAKPYWVALGLAMLSAALARELIDHAATPAVPTWGQLAAHALMLHDVLEHEGLSAGVWYVAIDFQLYALFIGMASLSLGLARHTGWQVRTWLALLCLGLTTLSLYAFNLEPGFDKWGLYFFGAYGLGALAFGIGQRRYKSPWLLGLSLLLVGALVMAWRDRLVLAGITAVVLACWGRLSELPALSQRFQSSVLPYLAERSYALFLVHYPTCLAVNAVVTWAWHSHLIANTLGLCAGWLLSIGAAELLYRGCEAPKPSRLRPWPSGSSWISLGRSTQRG